MAIKLNVRSVRDLGPQFADNPHDMVGQDGAYSIPMEDETLWFFGDTFLGRRVPGESLWYPGGVPVGHADMSGKSGIRRMINNCGLILPATDGRRGLRNFRYICDSTGDIRPLIPLAPDEDPDWFRIWCLHGIALGSKIILYFIKVEMLEGGPFPVNFRIVGSGLASGRRDEWTFRRILRNGSSILWGETDPHFATAVLHDIPSSWLYLYGSRQQASGEQVSCLARVRPHAIEDPASYEYLSALTPAWGPSPAQAIPVFSGMPNELSVSYNAYLGQYLAVHAFNLSGDLVGRTAPAPWGPWTDPIVLCSVRHERTHPLPYPPLVYAGKEHPELAIEDGQVLYLTYVEFEEYFPHLIEVTLA